MWISVAACGVVCVIVAVKLYMWVCKKSDEKLVGKVRAE